MWTFIRARATVAVIGDMEHWWLLTLLHFAGIRVIPVLHCTFWPKGHHSGRVSRRMIEALNGWFWRHVPVATISIPPECERQVRRLAGVPVRGALLQARPHYYRGYLDTIPPPIWGSRPFRILFAGRMERDKGIFDLLNLAERLRGFTQRKVVLEVCGSGNVQDEFVAAIERRRLGDHVHYLGPLDRHGMNSAYSRTHISIVPTTASFPEGLNQVVVESVLAGRFVIATGVYAQPSRSRLTRSFLSRQDTSTPWRRQSGSLPSTIRPLSACNETVKSTRYPSPTSARVGARQWAQLSESRCDHPKHEPIENEFSPIIF